MNRNLTANTKADGKQLVQLVHKINKPRLPGIQSYSHGLWLNIKTRTDYWKRLLTTTILVAFLYMFMEWLFFVTMPSFMSLMGLYTKLQIGLLSGWIFAMGCFVIVAVFIVIDLLALIAHISKITFYMGLAIPATILSALALLLVDNFTYTVFKFGISTSMGIGRAVYALLFVLLMGWIYYRILLIFRRDRPSASERRTSDRWFYLAVVILGLSTVVGLFHVNYTKLVNPSAAEQSQPTAGLPNIILLGSDGLNASHLSAYDYYRDTTPRLKELAKSSLVAQNAFTNAGNSAGSVISIMTSKLPTQTRVLYPPDILTGINSYQHLPGILKNLGYRTVEFGVPYYIDAFTYNLQGGFDVVNNRTIKVSQFASLGQKLGFENETYLLSRSAWRITDRLTHIFFIREMQNPFDLVTKPASNLSDEKKINQALSLFKQASAPLFIHIHLLGTHGGYYSPAQRVFSAADSQTQPWMTDFYDDTLLGFDAFVGEVIDQLKASGDYENTILIIYTDHNKEFKVDQRIPLMIHFPNDAYAGVITKNVENMDIAPTLLDYLGLAKPDWMEGESMLGNNLSTRRLIFSMGTSKVKPNEQDISFLDPALDKPPFYQFSYINILDCQKMYSLDLTSYQWTTEEVQGYVNPCNAQDLLSMDEIKQAVYQRLEQDGFDTAALP